MLFRSVVDISDFGRQMLVRAEDIERAGFSAELRPELRRELIALIRDLEVHRAGASAALQASAGGELRRVT